MIISQKITNNPSAGLARARLLKDIAHTRFSVASAAAYPTSASLSPDQQTRFAIQIAQSFKQHYLTEVVYLNDCQMAAATIKPANHTDIPHTIYVDTDGNVDVSYDFISQTRFPGWMLFIVGSTLVALIALLTSVLIAIL